LIWEPDGIGGVISPAERGLVFARLEAQAERARVMLTPHLHALAQLARALLDDGYLAKAEIHRLLPRLEKVIGTADEDALG
jgi:hypothetical protein